METKLENPWQVPSLDEYLFYCCPECDLKTKEYNIFYEHAVHRHEQAKILLVHDPDTKEDIKAEEEGDFKIFTQSTLNHHKKTRYQDLRGKCNKKSLEDLVQCYFCGFKSDNKHEVKEHVEAKHNQVEATTQMFGSPRKHQCQTCQTVFRKESTLNIHICGLTLPSMAITAKTGAEQCPKCDKVFVTHLDMLNHHAKEHTEEKKFNCDQCDYKGFTQKNVAYHKESAHQGQVRCDICHNLFKSERTLKKHHKEVHLMVKRQAKCDVCEFRSGLPEMRKHMKQEHPKHERFKCDLCDSSFLLKSDINVHKNQYHFSQEHQSLMCDICGKNFAKQQTLDNHVFVAHKDKCDSAGFTCDKCGRHYVTLQQLKQHLAVVHRQKFYICTLCEKIVTVRRKLKEHLSDEHNLNLPHKDTYVCDQCHKSFACSASLNFHLETEHSLTDTCHCPECDKRFVSQVLLTAHLMEHHDFDPFKSNLTSNSMEVRQHTLIQKKFKCEVCGHFLKSKDTLLTHTLQMHQKESHKYACDECDHTTFEAARLRRHKFEVHLKGRKRIRIKNIPCSECDKKFVTKEILAQHLLNEHNILIKNH